MCMVQCLPNVRIRIFSKGIQVHSQSSFKQKENFQNIKSSFFLTSEEDGVLGNDSDPGPQLAETQDPNVDAINLDGAACGLDDPEERQGQRGLARPGPSHDPDLLHALDVTVNPLEDQVKTLSVPCLYINQNVDLMKLISIFQPDNFQS